MWRGAAAVAPLLRAFFARPTVDVARDVIGCVLAVDDGTPEQVVARIVEVEAYLGLDDPASHAFRGPTPRAAIMFGEPGHLYVYLSRGIHHCANVVTEAAGTAGAVLVRAAAVEKGVEVVRLRRRSAAAPDSLLRGPGNLCRGLGLSLADNGIDVCGPSRVQFREHTTSAPVVTGVRVGISVATDRRLRFAWDGDPAVSMPQPWRKRLL